MHEVRCKRAQRECAGKGSLLSLPQLTCALSQAQQSFTSLINHMNQSNTALAGQKFRKNPACSMNTSCRQLHRNNAKQDKPHTRMVTKWGGTQRPTNTLSAAARAAKSKLLRCGRLSQFRKAIQEENIRSQNHIPLQQEWHVTSKPRPEKRECRALPQKMQTCTEYPPWTQTATWGRRHMHTEVPLRGQTESM